MPRGIHLRSHADRDHETRLFAHTFGSFHQFDLHHFFTHGFPSSDVEADQRAGLLQSLHGSAVGYVPDVHLVDSQDDVIDPEAQEATDRQWSELKDLILLICCQRQV